MQIKTPGGHNVTFEGVPTLLTPEVICDFIDMFYNYDTDKQTKWIISLDEKADFNGQHWYNPNVKEHHVVFCEKNIRKHFEKGRRDFGGNVKVPNLTVNTAAALVLAHELQHANQSKLHKGNELFYGYLGGFNSQGRPRMKNYKGRACERDAREFVDAHLNEIFAYFNLPPPRRNKVLVVNDSDELADVANILCECPEISMDDVRNELRASNILNPKNVQRLLEILHDRGVEFKARSEIG